MSDIKLLILFVDLMNRAFSIWFQVGDYPERDPFEEEEI